MARTGRRPTDRRGWVYLIINPAWPGRTKIGSTTRLTKRLNQYQTGSPHRDYQMVDALEFEDCVVAEAAAHSRLAGFRIGNTEWFSIDPQHALNLLRKIKDD